MITIIISTQEKLNWCRKSKIMSSTPTCSCCCCCSGHCGCCGCGSGCVVVSPFMFIDIAMVERLTSDPERSALGTPIPCSGIFSFFYFFYGVLCSFPWLINAFLRFIAILSWTLIETSSNFIHSHARLIGQFCRKNRKGARNSTGRRSNGGSGELLSILEG